MSDRKFSGRIINKSEATTNDRPVYLDLMAVIENKDESKIVIAKDNFNDVVYEFTNQEVNNKLDANGVSGINCICDYIINIFGNGLMNRLKISFVKGSIKFILVADSKENFKLIHECKNQIVERSLINSVYIDRITYKINKKRIKHGSNFSLLKLKMHEESFVVKKIKYKNVDRETGRYYHEVYHKIGEVYFKGVNRSIVNFGLREDFDKNLF